MVPGGARRRIAPDPTWSGPASSSSYRSSSAGRARRSAPTAADADDAALLDVPAGSPVLVAERITRSGAGRPVLVSGIVFAAHRTEFAVELPAAADVLGPAGLRLVE